MRVQKKIAKPNTPLDSSIDQGPYVNVAEDGMVAALNIEQTDKEEELNVIQGTHRNTHGRFPDEKVNEQDEPVTNANCDNSSGILQTAIAPDALPLDVTVHFKRYLGQLSRHNRLSIWLMVYIAITTSWPLVGSALLFVLRKKLRDILPGGLHRRR